MSSIHRICYNNFKVKAWFMGKKLSYYVRLMHKEDIAQVTEIDHEAFSSQWPPVNYERELQRWLARCIVACKENDEPPPPGKEYIMGCADFWMMADDAHITNLAVRETYRRRGIGELLLISMIDMARELGARILTLEVRASNSIAQSLYYKYGFTRVGVRRRYYTDNRENAVLMATEDISSTPFQSLLNRLKKTHSQKWGISLYQIAP